MNLSMLAPGALFRVIKVVLGKEVGRRLADMGFTEGAEGQVIRGGFLRGPFQVHIRGYDLLIRRCEAAGIEVEALGAADIPADAKAPFFAGWGAFWGRGPGCRNLGANLPRGQRGGRGRGRGMGRGPNSLPRQGIGRGAGFEQDPESGN